MMKVPPDCRIVGLHEKIYRFGGRGSSPQNSTASECKLFLINLQTHSLSRIMLI